MTFFWKKLLIYISACIYQSQECVVTVHFENGFILQDGRHHGILWQYPFEKLRMSADDGMRLVWLDFGGEDGEKVDIFI